METLAAAIISIVYLALFQLPSLFVAIALSTKRMLWKNHGVAFALALVYIALLTAIVAHYFVPLVILQEMLLTTGFLLLGIFLQKIKELRYRKAFIITSLLLAIYHFVMIFPAIFVSGIFGPIQWS